MTDDDRNINYTELWQKQLAKIEQRNFIKSVDYLKSVNTKAKPQPISYDMETGILAVDGRSYNFSSSEQAQGLLSVLFADQSNLTKHIKYEKLFFQNTVQLNRYGIERPDQIRQVKRFIQNKMQLNDLFPYSGYLVVNPKYL